MSVDPDEKRRRKCAEKQTLDLKYNGRTLAKATVSDHSSFLQIMFYFVPHGEDKLFQVPTSVFSSSFFWPNTW